MQDKKETLIRIIILIVIVLVVGLIGWTLVRQNRLSYTESVQPSGNTLAEWKTYHNQERGYSIDYPDSLIPKESTSSLTEFVKVNNPTDFSQTFNVAIYGRVATAESFSEYVKHAYYTEENMTDARLGSINKVVTTTGIVGYETTWTDSVTNIYFPLPDNDRSGVIVITQSQDNSISPEVYSRVLSSFRYSSSI